MTYRSSFSQHKSFENCPRCWYMSSIQKIPTISDYTYAHAGDIIHKILDKYHSGEKDIDVLKVDFERRWASYNLVKTELRFKKDSYWGMCLIGFDINVQLTSTELKIYYPEVVAFLDGVDTINDIIIDWKSSTRSAENEEEYRLQLRMYAWLYYRKFGRIPNMCKIYYLKYSGSKGELTFNFTLQDIEEAEKWYTNILQQMEYYVLNPDKLPHFNRNYFFSPYKSFWDTENNGELKAILHLFGNYIQLEGYIPELLEKGIKRKFSYELKEAHWIKKARPMANTTICFWNSKKQMLPLGMKDGLLITLQHYAEHKQIGLNLEIVEHREFDNTVVQMPEKFINNITLRDYQKEAVEIFLRKKLGILELATGSGKTEIAIEIIRRLQCKVLFIVDKKELQNQTVKRIQEALGIEVGIIGQGISRLREITVATIQTLIKHPNEYAHHLKEFKFVIFDETHKVAAKSYVKISKYLTGTEYRLGLSGTAFRDDGNDMQITAVTGNIIHNLDSKTLIERGWLVKPYITFIKNYMPKDIITRWESDLSTGLINEMMDYNDYYIGFIMNNEYRNNKIVEIVNNNKDKKILILTKLIDHGKLLNQLLPGSKHLYGGSNKKEREKMFNEFVHGEEKILISTIPIWSEGLDCRPLSVIINAGANTGSVKTIQMLGRILRTSEGKETATYYDFVDETKFFRLGSIKRMKTLRKQGHDVSQTI